jgi:Protein of unknown function (DUF3300)
MKIFRTVAVAGMLFVPFGTSIARGQEAQPAQAVQRTSLTPQQMDNLVAPLALYPDPLLSQVLVASTYPLELVQANQWLAQNRQLTGTSLTDAAKQQNWDPSVQAMVAFPDVLTRMNQDVRWTTDLGNAFLGQQADVMSAVQRLRARAQANGKLQTTPQETVTTQTQDGQTAIAIQPADPQVIYVPTYDPTYVWGAPAYGYYPSLFYPSYGFGFGFGIPFGGLYVGWGGWGGWGWGPNWFGRSIYVNGGFFNHYGYRYGGGYGYRGGAGFAGNRAWAHDSAHSPRVGGTAGYSRSYSTAAGSRASAGGGYRGGAAGGASQGYRGGSAASGYRGGATASSANRGYAGQGAARSNSYAGSVQRSYSAPSRSYSAPAQRSYSGGGSQRSYSAPSHMSSGGGGGGFHGGGGGHAGGGGGSHGGGHR